MRVLQAILGYLFEVVNYLTIYLVVFVPIALMRTRCAPRLSVLVQGTRLMVVAKVVNIALICTIIMLTFGYWALAFEMWMGRAMAFRQWELRGIGWVLYPMMYVCLFAGSCIVGICLYRGRRKPPEGCCQRCGYNLEGTVKAGRSCCPECGAAITLSDILSRA